VNTLPPDVTSGPLRKRIDFNLNTTSSSSATVRSDINPTSSETTPVASGILSAAAGQHRPFHLTTSIAASSKPAAAASIQEEANSERLQTLNSPRTKCEVASSTASVASSTFENTGSCSNLRLEEDSKLLPNSLASTSTQSTTVSSGGGDSTSVANSESRSRLIPAVPSCFASQAKE
jgi:hypothetical protein